MILNIKIKVGIILLQRRQCRFGDGVLGGTAGCQEDGGDFSAWPVAAPAGCGPTRYQYISH